MNARELLRYLSYGTCQRGFTDGCHLSRDCQRTADDWLENIDELRDVVMSYDPGHNYERVRVCVIDTGLREDYKATCSAFRGFRDFVDPTNTRVCDNSSGGHGTLCAHIILSVFDECDLYVARVFADDNADDETGSVRMAEVRCARCSSNRKEREQERADHATRYLLS